MNYKLFFAEFFAPVGDFLKVLLFALCVGSLLISLLYPLGLLTIYLKIGPPVKTADEILATGAISFFILILIFIVIDTICMIVKAIRNHIEDCLAKARR